jgi:hypothetical protein
MEISTKIDEEILRSAQEQLMNQASGLFAGIEEGAREGRAVHEVEQFLWDRLLIMGHSLLEIYFRM